MNFLEPRVTKALEGGRVNFINLLISSSICYIYLPSLIVLKNDDTKFKRIRTEEFFSAFISIQYNK